MQFVVGSLFMFSNFYPLDSHYESCVAIAILQSAKMGLKIGRRLIWLWSSEVHVCWFNIGPPNFFHYLNVEQLSRFEDVVRSLSSMRLYAVCSWILTEPQHCIPLVTYMRFALNTEVIQWNYLLSLGLLMKALACPKDGTMVNSWQNVFVHLTFSSFRLQNADASARTIPTHPASPSLRFTLIASTFRTMATVHWLYRFFNLDFTPLSLKWTFHTDLDNWALILRDLRSSWLWRPSLRKHQTSTICRVHSKHIQGQVFTMDGWMGGTLLCNNYLSPIDMCN